MYINQKNWPLTSEENWARCRVTKSRSWWFRSQYRVLMFQERIPVQKKKKEKEVSCHCHYIYFRNRSGEREMSRTHKDQGCSTRWAYLGWRKSSEAEDHKMLTFHKIFLPEEHAVSKSPFNLDFMQGKPTRDEAKWITLLPNQTNTLC